MRRLDALRAERGLRVHGLLVGRRDRSGAIIVSITPVTMK